MNMVPVDPKEIKVLASRRAHRKVMHAIEQFINSPYDAVELKWEPGEYVSAASVAASYSKAIRKMHVGCFACVRQDRVYLIRKEMQ